jgi:hypothetical protein
LDGWGLNRLRLVSQRVGEYEWRRAEQSVLVKLSDPVAVTTPAFVTMTAWRELPAESMPFVRVIDLSGVALELLPDDAALKGLVWLEGVVLPTGLRVLPQQVFSECWRLASIDTRWTALEKIEYGACDECRSLAAFVFPPTVRSLECAFGGTSITTLDLSGTVVENAWIEGMVSLVELALPRRCVLRFLRGVPSLRRVTVGTPLRGCALWWHPAEVRFESMTADAGFSPGLLEARVYGEVACELGCDTIPFPPP